MPIRLALVGYGYWGKIVARHLDAHAGFELLRIASPTLLDEGRTTPDVERTVSDPLVQVVYVAVPVEHHFWVVKLALLAGKHVLCEKPLTTSTAQATELARLAREHSLVLETNYIYNHSKGVKCLVGLADRIGPLRHVHLRMGQLGKFYEESVYHVLGSHMLSVVDTIVGLSGLDLTFQNLICNDRGGIESGLIVGMKAGVSIEISLSLRSVVRERIIEIIGDKGGARFDPQALHTVCLVLHDQGRPVAGVVQTETWNFDESRNLDHVLDAFASLIAGIGASNLERSVEITRILEGR